MRGPRWLAERRRLAVGADTIAFEHLPAGKGHAAMPAHRVLLVDSGINIIETLNLEEVAADEVHEFTLVLAPLPGGSDRFACAPPRPRHRRTVAPPLPALEPRGR